MDGPANGETVTFVSTVARPVSTSVTAARSAFAASPVVVGPACVLRLVPASGSSGLMGTKYSMRNLRPAAVRYSKTEPSPRPRRLALVQRPDRTVVGQEREELLAGHDDATSDAQVGDLAGVEGLVQGALVDVEDAGGLGPGDDGSPGSRAARQGDGAGLGGGLRRPARCAVPTACAAMCRTAPGCSGVHLDGYLKR